MPTPKRRRRSRRRSALPKGAYRVPNGGYAFNNVLPSDPASNAGKNRVRVVDAVYREHPDTDDWPACCSNLIAEPSASRNAIRSHRTRAARRARTNVVRPMPSAAATSVRFRPVCCSTVA